MSTTNAKGFTLEQYSPEYISECVKLFFDVFTDKPFNFNITESNMKRYLTDLTSFPNFKGYLYFMNGRLVGVCLGVVLDYFSSVTYDIKEIAVSKDCQGLGIGGALLRVIEEDLATAGVMAVTLATQKELDAFKFYIKKGYTASESTVYMSKPL